MPSNNKTFRIPQTDSEIKALTLLLGLSDKTMIALVDLLEKEPPALDFMLLASRLKQKLETPVKGLVSVLRVMGTIYWTFVKGDVPESDFLPAFRKALKTIGKPEFQLDNQSWEAFSVHLSRILKCDRSLGITAKALEVMTANEHTLLSTRIFSDLRPIFSEKVDAFPSAAVLIHNLRIEYLSAGEKREFFAAMDSHDLKELASIVQRAILKEKTMHDSLKNSSISILEPDHSP
jgi:hypothetical protein